MCRPPLRRGFTLLEVLLSLAIIALLATVLIGGSAALLEDKPVSADEVFWKAVQEARKTALKAGHEIRLKYDAEKKQFVLLDGFAPPAPAMDGLPREEVPLKQFPLSTARASEITVDFLAAGKGGNPILVGGVLLESQPVPFVRFYEDGTCTPFRLQIALAGSAHTLAIDPWTCAPVLETKEKESL